MIPFEFHPDALREADASASFYKSKQAGLEKRFLAALEDAITRIRINPLIYHKMEANIRKCRLTRFPYGLVYRVTDDCIEIIAVMHLRQSPGFWKDRT